jgi:hypothetical protein
VTSTGAGRLQPQAPPAPATAHQPAPHHRPALVRLRQALLSQAHFEAFSRPVALHSPNGSVTKSTRRSTSKTRSAGGSTASRPVPAHLPARTECGSLCGGRRHPLLAPCQRRPRCAHPISQLYRTATSSDDLGAARHRRDQAVAGTRRRSLSSLVQVVVGNGQGEPDGVGGASGGGKPEGSPTPQARLTGGAAATFRSSANVWQGQDSNLCRRGRRFPGRSAVSPRVPSHPHPVPIMAHDLHKRPADNLRRHPAFPPAPPRPARSSVGRRVIPAAILTRGPLLPPRVRQSHGGSEVRPAKVNRLRLQSPLGRPHPERAHVPSGRGADVPVLPAICVPETPPSAAQDARGAEGQGG